MSSTKILFQFIGFFVVFALCIFIAGLGETTRLEAFTITEMIWGNYSKVCADPTIPVSQCQNFVPDEESNSYQDYVEFKEQYLFTNTPFILILNFLGLFGILYFVYISWNEGYNSPPLSLNEIFRLYSILLVIIFYLIGILFNYLKDIFVDQLIIVLFEDIYSQVYMFQLLQEHFFTFILLGFLLLWLGNQIRFFDNFQRQ